MLNNNTNLNQSQVCPVCNGHDASYMRDVFDDRYGHPDLFTLIKCQSCGHLMTSPMPNEDDLAQLYGNYYPRKKLSVNDIVTQATDVRLPFSKIRRWLMGNDNQGQYSAHSGEKMLDIGCGSGLSLLEAQILGVDAWGIDADPNAKRFADELDLRIHQGSLHDNPFEDISYDLIVLNQVIEHIPEPDKALRLILTRLAKDGRVILVFPNINSLWCKITGKSWINWHIPYHLHHFNKKTFTQMATRCGYQVVRSRTITPNIWTILQLRASRKSVVRGQSNSIWEVKTPNTSHQSKISKRIFLRKILLPAVLVGIAIVNRIVDIFGYGDSLMVELKPIEQKKSLKDS